MPKKNVLTDVYALLGLLALNIVFNFRVLFLGRVFCFRDFHRYFYPYKYFAAEWIRKFYVPLWNPHCGCGSPFFAGLQSQVFYPLSVLTYIMPFTDGLHFFIVFHYILGSFFTYAFCRDLKLSRPASFISASVFTFGGYLVSSADMVTTLCSAVWLPLILLFFNRSLEQEKIFEKWSYAALTSVFLCIQFLAGEPTVLFGTLLAMLILNCFHLKQRANVFVLPATGLLAAGFSAFQLFPFLEFLANSNRAAPQAGMVWSMPPYQLLNFIIPYIGGDITGRFSGSYFDLTQMWLKSCYVGLIPVLLAACGVFFRKAKGGDRKSVV
jgi:hypothetical protein